MSELIIAHKDLKNKLHRTINLTACLDTTLSWKAKGIQTYIRTRPSKWQIWISDLIDRSRDNEASLRTGIKELIDKKYLYRTNVRDRKNRRIARWAFVSFDEPTEITDEELKEIVEEERNKILDFQDVDSLYVENQVYSNKIDSNNNDIIIDDSNDSNERESKDSSHKESRSKTFDFSSDNNLKLLDNENIDIIKFWNSMGKPLAVHRLNRKNNKVVERALKILRKKREKFTEQELKEPIRTYKTLLTNENTILNIIIPGHLVGIDEFFGGFNKFTLERMRKQKVVLDIKSWFDECQIFKDPIGKFIDVKKRIKDIYPDVTDQFKKNWIKQVLGGIKPDRFNLKDENCFKMASKRTIDFFENNKKKLHISKSEINNQKKLVKYVFEALENDLNGDMSMATPGWLCSDTMFNRRLPTYLHEQAMVIDE